MLKQGGCDLITHHLPRSSPRVLTNSEVAPRIESSKCVTEGWIIEIVLHSRTGKPGPPVYGQR